MKHEAQVSSSACRLLPSSVTAPNSQEAEERAKDQKVSFSVSLYHLFTCTCKNLFKLKVSFTATCNLFVMR